MDKTGKLASALCRRLQLPGEILAAQPKIEWTGQEMISVEPHRGLLEYGREEIRLQTTLGPLQIAGEGLRIALMNRHRIVVEGKVQSAAWLSEEHE